VNIAIQNYSKFNEYIHFVECTFMVEFVNNDQKFLCFWRFNFHDETWKI